MSLGNFKCDVVLGLSGGMDSSTLLGYYLDQGKGVLVCSFLYGSKHSPYEIEAVNRVLAYYRSKGYPIVSEKIDLRPVFSMFKSDLLVHGGDIPEGHYAEESMKRTVVPCRNIIMTCIMAGLAKSNDCDTVALGVHSGDHFIYPDCRQEFTEGLSGLLEQAEDVRLDTPFQDLDKAGILELGYGFKDPTPYEVTRTCYKAQPIACGKCGSCVERLEAFEKIGKVDPIEYEVR